MSSQFNNPSKKLPESVFERLVSFENPNCDAQTSGVEISNRLKWTRVAIAGCLLTVLSVVTYKGCESLTEHGNDRRKANLIIDNILSQIGSTTSQTVPIADFYFCLEQAHEKGFDSIVGKIEDKILLAKIEMTRSTPRLRRYGHLAETLDLPMDVFADKKFMIVAQSQDECLQKKIPTYRSFESSMKFTK